MPDYPDREYAGPQSFWDAVKAAYPLPEASMGMEPAARYHLTQALGSLMSDWSEDVYSASWLSGLEEELPAMIRKELKRTYNRPSIRSDIHPDVRRHYETMAFIADMLGHWARYEWYETGGGQYVPHVPKCDRAEDSLRRLRDETGGAE